MKFVFFLPQGGVIESNRGEHQWCVRGAFAYQRDVGKWYRWEADPESDTHARWFSVPIARIPPEHRTYILLNP